MVNSLIAYARYLMGLANKNINEDIRNAARDAIVAQKFEENVFYQILEAYTKDMTADSNVDEVISTIQSEYELLGLNGTFGEFHKWDQFIRFCITEHFSDDTIQEIVEKSMLFVDEGTEIDSAIKYAVYASALTFYISPSQAFSQLELLQKLIDYNNGLEEAPIGSHAMMYLVEFIRN